MSHEFSANRPPDEPSHKDSQANPLAAPVFDRTERVARRPWVVFAWAVILLAVGGIVSLNTRGSKSSSGAFAQGMAQELQERYMVGASQIPGAAAPMAQTINESFRPDDHAAALRTVALAAEIVGTKAGEDKLAALIAHWENSTAPSAEDRQLADSLGLLLAARQKPELIVTELPVDDSQRIESRLGWLGKLALHPAGGPDSAARVELLRQASQTTWTILGIAVAATAALFIGVALLGLWSTLAGLGKLRFRFEAATGTGGYYAETFAIWFVGFFCLQLGLGARAPRRYMLTMAGIASAISLLALGWPVFRGIPWSQVRRETGLVLPGGAWKEPLLGGLAYLAGLPVVFLGMLATLGLMRILQIAPGTLLSPFAEAPVHPIIEPLAVGSPFERIQAITIVLLVPITEEIMFRGVLQRHLREATQGLGWLRSTLFSLLSGSFLFAVIHPQGILGVPLLMAVAIVLGVLREWRGSLIAPTVTHMVVNGVTTSLVLLLFA